MILQCILLLGLFTVTALSSNESICIRFSFATLVDQSQVICDSYAIWSNNVYLSDEQFVPYNFTNRSLGRYAMLSPYLTAAVLTKSFGELAIGTFTTMDFFSGPSLKEAVKMIAGAAVKIIEHYNWKRVIILADGDIKFFAQVAELIYARLSGSNYSAHYYQVHRHFSATQIISEVSSKNFNIVVMSLSSSKVKRVLAKRQGELLKWPMKAWLVHSVQHEESLDSENLLEGTMLFLLRNFNCMQSQTNNFNRLCPNYSCSPVPNLVDIFLRIDHRRVFLSSYSYTSGLGKVSSQKHVPSDHIPQRVPHVFIAVYYIGILSCYILVTTTLILFIYYRNEPEVKATSTSLSILIFIGCYIWIFYLAVLNSTLLPSYHTLSGNIRNFICVFRVWLHGLGYPVALIMCTILVKLLRVYRIFHCHGKISMYTSGNAAMAVYTFILTSPNALICLIWSSSDPYLSELILKIDDGQVVITEQCRSQHTLLWLSGLLVYLVLISLGFLVAATLTRNVHHENFKDTKKAGALGYIVILSLAIILSYWFFLRIIGADVVLVHAVLQIGHWWLIIQCQLLLFAPKLYPILKLKIARQRSTPVPKD